MPTEPKKNRKPAVDPKELARLRMRAAEARAKLAHKPGVPEVLSKQELADATPFYFELQGFIAALKAARLAAGLTLADVAAKTGMAVETLSRLETGALTNPTFQTLAKYAAAVGRRPQFELGGVTEPTSRSGLADHIVPGEHLRCEMCSPCESPTATAAMAPPADSDQRKQE